MKKIPDSELEIMMIIWKVNRPVTRNEIEEELKKNVSAPTILSFLSRLEKRGFLIIEKKGKINWYTAVINKNEYLQKESMTILKKMYQNSIKNFVTALYDGNNLTDADLIELKDYLEKIKNEKNQLL